MGRASLPGVVPAVVPEQRVQVGDERGHAERQRAPAPRAARPARQPALQHGLRVLAEVLLEHARQLCRPDHSLYTYSTDLICLRVV